MRRITRLLLMFALAGLLLPCAQAQQLQWAKQFGGTGYDYGYSVAVDQAGNVYSTGLFSTTADLDPGPGVFNLISTGAEDYYVSKLDALGNFVWAKAFGSTGSQAEISLTADNNGFIYLTGTVIGIADFDPGPAIYNLGTVGKPGIFALKLDNNGNFIWARCFADTATGPIKYNHVAGFGILTDASGEVLVTGKFSDTIDFDPGPGSYPIWGERSSIFILKLDSNGNFLWVKHMETNSTCDLNTAFAITMDPAGNIITTGTFADTVDFDPGPGIYNLITVPQSPMDYDIFVSKLDHDGNFMWAKQWGGTTLDEGRSVVTDASANVYVTGRFTGSALIGMYPADFDPGPGVYWINPPGGGGISNDDIFISKLDANGNFVWAKVIGSYVHDMGFDVAIDQYASLYITGVIGSADFDPDTSTYYVPVTGGSSDDAFIWKLDSSGHFIWVKKFGGNDDDGGLAITLDSTGNIYLTGYFIYSCDFDPDLTAYLLSAAGDYDAYLLKLGYSSTSIESIDNVSQMMISPNPTSGEFTLKISNGFYELINPEIRICNSTGKVVYEAAVVNESSNFSLMLNPGIYFIHVLTEGKIFERKKICIVR